MKVSLIRLIILWLSFYLSACNILPNNAKTQNDKQSDVKIILMAGQSNMAGAGDFDALSPAIVKRLKAVQNRVRIMDNGSNIKPLSYDIGNKQKRKKYGTNRFFGPELMLGIILAETEPEQNFLIVKTSQGGTALYGAWNPFWSLEKSKQVEKGEFKQNLKLFDTHINAVKNAQLELTIQNKSYQLSAIFWMQGENDAAKKVSALSYQDNLITLIQQYRQQLNRPDIPFIFGQINSRYGQFKQGPSIVRQAMENVAQTGPNTQLIKTTANPPWFDYPKHTDNVHYNTQGVIKLGQAFAYVANEFVKN